jgi:hypothetical protein
MGPDIPEPEGFRAINQCLRSALLAVALVKENISA